MGLLSQTDEFLDSASPSAYVKGGEAHIPAVIFHKHKLSLVIWNTHWQSMENNPSRSVSGFCGLQGICLQGDLPDGFWEADLG